MEEQPKAWMMIDESEPSLKQQFILCPVVDINETH